MKLLLDWMDDLPLQQQAVLVMACRGFDGTVKHSAHKPFVRTLRAHCLTAAKYGRAWEEEDGYNDFMTLFYIGSDNEWSRVCDEFMKEWDSYNVHALMHLIHAIEVLGYKLPSMPYRNRWMQLYRYICGEGLHVQPETKASMDVRLDDWGKRYWVPKNV